MLTKSASLKVEAGTGIFKFLRVLQGAATFEDEWPESSSDFIVCRNHLWVL